MDASLAALHKLVKSIMPTDITTSTMSQPWFGQHGAATAGANQSQQSGNMHHQRYHHGNAAAAAAAPAQGAASTYARSSPPVARPPSSNSVSSTSSYHSAPGPAPGQAHSNLNRHQGHGMDQGPRAASHLSGHPGHAGIRSMTSGRYPMPPRNGMAHPVRPIPRGPMPLRQHHGMHAGGHMVHSRMGNGSAQPPRSALGGMAPTEYGHNAHNAHNAHSQFGSKPANSMLGRSGMHHSMPYRHMHGMNGNGGGHGYRQGSHANNYHQFNHRQMHSQHQDQKYQQYRATGASPSLDSQASSHAPSPPPVPPVAQGETQQTKSVAPVVAKSAESSSVNPLRERQNVQQGDNNSNVQQGKPAAPSAQKPANEDLTADAASILLQLSAVVKTEGTTDSHGQDENSGNQENKPSHCMVVGHRNNNTAKPAAKETHTIEESHSHDNGSTISPSETMDSAPDLTSEPSSDSIEQESEFPAAIPENYPTRLALPYDDSKLNSLHCFLRSELLEIFVVQKSLNKSPTHSPGSSVGRVGLRCVHCAFTKRPRDDRDEAPMAVFYPKSIAEIYRLVTSWQRCHLRKCRNLPPAVRSKWQLLRENDKSRGKTHYWITSAKEIGLIDCQSRAGGIRFGPQTNKNASAATPAPAPTQDTTTSAMDTTSSNAKEQGENIAPPESASVDPSISATIVASV